MSARRVLLKDVLEVKAQILESCILEKETSTADLWATWLEITTQQLNNKDPVAEVFLSADSFNYMVGCPQFVAVIDPVSRHEEILEGKLGTCLGATLWTEAYRPPYERVLAEGEVMFNTVNDQWIHLTIKDNMSHTSPAATPSETATPESSSFVLNSETRSVAYAFLKENPGYNIEDSGDPLSTIIGKMGVNCVKDKDPVTEIVLSSHAYTAFLGCSELIASLEPVTRIREMMEGKVGYLVGSTVYTEAYMHPVEQTMGPKEILFHTQSNKWFRVYTRRTLSANV